MNINLFSGPGAGKSSTAAGLFHNLKKMHIDVEYIPEYAKELVYANETVRLSDQLHVMGEQYHRLKRINDKVDIIIHDSPFILGLVYLVEDEHLPKKEFKDFSIKLFNTYDNINIFLNRNTDLKYQQLGRSQNLEESIKKDKKIKKMLNKNNIKYYDVDISDNTIQDILNILIDNSIIKDKNE